MPVAPGSKPVSAGSCPNIVQSSTVDPSVARGLGDDAGIAVDPAGTDAPPPPPQAASGSASANGASLAMDAGRIAQSYARGAEVLL
jgi:hypothetical protein